MNDGVTGDDTFTITSTNATRVFIDSSVLAKFLCSEDIDVFNMEEVVITLTAAVEVCQGFPVVGWFKLANEDNNATSGDLPETSKKNSKKIRNFFFSIFSFLRAFVVSSCRKNGFRVFLSLRYGADLGRSRLVLIVYMVPSHRLLFHGFHASITVSDCAGYIL